MLAPVPSSYIIPPISTLKSWTHLPFHLPNGHYYSFFTKYFNAFLVSTTMSGVGRGGANTSLVLWRKQATRLKNKYLPNPPPIYTCLVHPWFHYPNNPAVSFYWTFIRLTILTILSNFYRSWRSLPYANILNCSLTSSPFRSQYFLHTRC
jgi:hypothetical protein